MVARNDPGLSRERATERVAVLMTPTEKAAYTNQAHSLGLSLGQFFREAGAAYAHRSTNHPGTTQRSAEADIRALAEAEALEAALNQLELSTSRTEQTLDAALAEVRTALMRAQS